MSFEIFGLAVTPTNLSAFFQVVMINIVMSGDNAIVIGMAVAGLKPEQRNVGLFWGIVGATVMRLIFTGLAVEMMNVIGLILLGGVLLLWVTWKMWREIYQAAKERRAVALAEGQPVDPETEKAAEAEGAPEAKTMRQAVIQILIADMSMSLDNVLAVAGASREHPYIMAFGLTLSIALTAIASKAIARLLDRYHWLGYVGVAVIAFVALEMIWDGTLQVVTETGIAN